MAATPYVGKATFVASFAIDKTIRYKIGDIERAFQPVFTAQAVSTNVPDNGPPPIPRFTMQSGPKQISISQVTVQLDLNFDEQRKSIANTFAILEKNFASFWNGVCQLKRVDEIKNAGLVLTINSPSQGTREEVCSQILERYAKVPARGAAANASIQFGFKDDSESLYKNVSLQYYEVRTGTIPLGAPAGTTLVMEVASLPVQEKGYETKVDINSRPMEEAHVATTSALGAVLVGSMKAFTADWGKEFFTWN